jgi:twitching motility protein PilT
MARLDELFRFMKDNKASDLHLAAGLEPRIRRHGHLEKVPNWPVLSDAELRGLLREIPSAKHWEHYEAKLDCDFAYGLEGVARFRANYFNQENGAGAVFRIIPEEIIPLQKLNLPPATETLTTLEHGLVLVTGPTGSGKSTTLASIIDKINQEHDRHIITIEDPIEFVHPNKRSTISQREVGCDTQSFANALRAAMRQDPNVILVGELRDYETIALAITAAEMGVLVFGTLHTNSASKTIDRVIDVFPTDQQRQVRGMLASSLAGVASQLLLRTADGKGRVAALELLLRTTGLANVIREGNTPMINSIIQGGRKEGMQMMDDALYALAKEGKVSGEDAWLKATNKKRFEEFAPQG